jgi:uncharacterized repeat protein (TIGR03803 family)
MKVKLAWNRMNRGRTSLALALSLTAMVAAVTSSEAQTYTVIHTFAGGSDGIEPESGLLLAPDGLHGNTYGGGEFETGALFRIDNAGNYTVRAFPGCCNVYPQGANPLGTLIRDAAGSLYGTTYRGGNTNNYGTIFKVDKTGRRTVLHKFVGTDGIGPWAPLIMDAAGNLYGTAAYGGNLGGNCGFSGCGTIFKLDTAGQLTVLYKFQNGADGVRPLGSLALDPQGSLYGIASQGGSFDCVGGGCGTLFKLDTSGTITILHVFLSSDTYGIFPIGGVIRDQAGNLYGTADAGSQGDHGTVFRLDPQNRMSVLYHFQGGSDGSGPATPVIRDPAGNLYGTTEFGGDLSCTLLGNQTGCGTVFKLDTTGQETVLYRFHGTQDGGFPQGGLVIDPAGNLYGTTEEGGDFGCEEFSGCGVVFEVAP